MNLLFKLYFWQETSSPLAFSRALLLQTAFFLPPFHHPFFFSTALDYIHQYRVKKKKKKNLPANALDVRDTGSISPSVRCPGRGHSNPLQCSLTGSIGLQRVRHHWSNIACIEMLFHFSILQTKQSKPKKNQTKTNNKHQIAQFLFQTR